MSEVSKSKAILDQRCPRCREGHMFKYSTLNYKRFNKMHANCPQCGLRFEVEPGFFQGAMYVSYGINVALFLVVGLITSSIFDDPGTWTYMGMIILSVLIFLPVTYRYSRIIFLHLFSGVRYNRKS